MRLNAVTERTTIRTHEGGRAKNVSAEASLRRTLMTCMLWEDGFYEDGKTISQRLSDLIPLIQPEVVVSMALEAKIHQKLRHAPLLIAVEMLKHPKHKLYVGDLLIQIIERPDELCETLSMYWKDGRRPLAHQLKKGLGRAFKKFDEYSLAKYNRDTPIKLRDILFLCEPTPKDKAQKTLWKKLIDGKLATPDTWEVAISATSKTKEPKKLVWERLLKEGKLGPQALLKNLRNMGEEKVSSVLIRDALNKLKTDKILPWQIIAAAKAAPEREDLLELLLFKTLGSEEKIMLGGKTTLLVDVSGSMDEKLSSKGITTRLDAACGVAMLARELCEEVEIVTFSNQIALVPPRRGFALRDAIISSQPHSGTYLGNVLQGMIRHGHTSDRLIIITDEQTADKMPDPIWKLAYVINVGSNQNGVGYYKWMHIDGWSEKVLDFIIEKEIQDYKAKFVSTGTFGEIDRKEPKKVTKAKRSKK